MRNFRPTRYVISVTKQRDSIAANKLPAFIIGKNINAYRR